MVATTTTRRIKVAISTVEGRLRKASEIGDALAAAKAANDLMTQIDSIKKAAVDLRALRVWQANKSGVTYTMLAAELGISKTLVQQLVALGKALDEGSPRPVPKAYPRRREPAAEILADKEARGVEPLD